MEQAAAQLNLLSRCLPPLAQHLLLFAQTRNTARAQKRCNTLLWRELCANISAAVGSLRAASHRSSLTAPPLFRPAWVRPNQPELLVPGCTWWYFWWYLWWYLCGYFCHWSSPPQTCQGAPQPEMRLTGTFSWCLVVLVTHWLLVILVPA